MHRDHETFLRCLHGRCKVELTFHSKEDATQLVRTCAPMDYGPSRRAKDASDRYHLWDYDSDARQHTLSLLEVQVISIRETADAFDPAEFVTWDVHRSQWFTPRDWGRFS